LVELFKNSGWSYFEELVTGGGIANSRKVLRRNKDVDNVLLSHLARCARCRGIFHHVLADSITEKDLHDAEKQLDLGSRRPGRCPPIVELANYAALPQQDPILPCQLDGERVAAIRSHLEDGCHSCQTQVTIAQRRLDRPDLALI